MSFVVDRRDLDFVLFEMLGVDALAGTDRYATYDRATIRQMIDAAQQLAETRFLPIAAEIDRDEPRFVDGAVEMPESAAEALRAHAEAGYFSLPFDEASGGLQAPWVLHTAIGGIFVCANTAVANYAFLTTAAAHLLESFGSEELKRRFIPPMLAGRWFGTMCLSEPQAGSSLADIRTTATPVEGEEGVYRITGTKTWISGGDQNISDNIVHMVIAKIPGGPAGTKGISLFLVPKVRVGADGTLGPRNNVVLAGLNHKMGQRGTTNCLLNFGEGGDCLGFLLGEPHCGIEYMFQMMNEARIEVGHSATMQGLAGYLYSADYARTRLQGRPVGDRDPARGQVPIIEHADVKRMLLAQKAAVEGAQALCLYSAWLVDKMATETDEARRAWYYDLLGLLTPVVKSWPSEHCLEANKWAIQILGGYGYTRDYPVERLYRDNRLNHIHEGTFGIQGMDLLGRKVAGDGGKTLLRFVDQMRDTATEAARHARLAEPTQRLLDGLERLSTSTRALLDCKDPALRLANATIYLDAFGHVVIGWIWLWQATLAAEALYGPETSTDKRSFYEGKVLACLHFSRHQLPVAMARLDLCGSLDATSLEATAGTFDQG